MKCSHLVFSSTFELTFPTPPAPEITIARAEASLSFAFPWVLILPPLPELPPTFPPPLLVMDRSSAMSSPRESLERGKERREAAGALPPFSFEGELEGREEPIEEMESAAVGWLKGVPVMDPDWV